MCGFDSLCDFCQAELTRTAEALNGLYTTLDEQEVDTSKQKLPSYLQYRQPSRQLLLAQTYFNCREFDRCAWVLEKCTSDPAEVFLRNYAKFLSGEKTKEEAYQGILSSQENIEQNAQVASILKSINCSSQPIQDDPFIQYLLGVIHRRQRNESQAVIHLVRAIEGFLYNWSAWQELLLCIPVASDMFRVVDRLLPNGHVIKDMFTLVCKQEFHDLEQPTYDLLEDLQRQFPSLLGLNVQKALLDYHGLNYEDAEQEFQNVLLRDPHRLDNMDTYSNILYVLEKTTNLSYLAQIANATDKYRPESCCIIANYYSLKSQHQLAILYYERALTLDRTCYSAWTLMGHEFIEIKNAHAAIECYRRVVDVNKRDYRAWYGLGQAYELQDLPYYSLFYYEKAIALKPDDARTWLAIAACYEKLNRNTESIKALKRALTVSDMVIPVLHRIGTMYEKENDLESAARYMEMCVTEEASSDEEDGETIVSQARLWLANYEFQRGNLSAALVHAERVTRAMPTEYEDARKIIEMCRDSLH